MNTSDKEKLRDYLLDGLYTDDAHHKQDALDKSLMTILSPEEIQMLKDQYGDWNEDY